MGMASRQLCAQELKGDEMVQLDVLGFLDHTHPAIDSALPKLPTRGFQEPLGLGILTCGGG